jgi:hypothetical protein
MRKARFLAIPAVLLLLTLSSMHSTSFATLSTTAIPSTLQPVSNPIHTTPYLTVSTLEKGYGYLEDNLNPSLILIRGSSDIGSHQENKRGKSINSNILVQVNAVSVGTNYSVTLKSPGIGDELQTF